MSIKKKNKSKMVEYLCNTCGSKKNFPAKKDKDYRTWLEKPESVVEVVS